MLNFTLDRQVVFEIMSAYDGQYDRMDFKVLVKSVRHYFPETWLWSSSVSGLVSLFGQIRISG